MSHVDRRLAHQPEHEPELTQVYGTAEIFCQLGRLASVGAP